MKIRAKMLAVYGILFSFGFLGGILVPFSAGGMMQNLSTTQHHAGELVLNWTLFTHRTKDILLLETCPGEGDKLGRLLTRWKIAYSEFKESLFRVKADPFLVREKGDSKKHLEAVMELWGQLQPQILELEERLRTLQEDILPRVDVDGNLLYILYFLEEGRASGQAYYARHIGETRAVILKLTDEDDTFSGFLSRLAMDVEEEIRILNSRIKFFSLAINLLIMLINLVIIFIFSDLITRRIKIVEKAISAVSQGDFSVEMGIHTRDEFGRLSRNFGYFVNDLRRNIDSVFDFMKHVSTAMSGEMTLEATLGQIVKSVAMAITAEGVAVLVVHQAEGLLELKGGTGVFHRFEGQIPLPGGERSFPWKGTVYEKVVITCKPLFLRTFPAETGVRDFQTGSCIVVPLLVDDGLFALLSMVRRMDSEPFTDLDFTNARTFAEFSGLTLANFNRYMFKQERNRLRLEMAVAEKIQTTLLPGDYDSPEWRIVSRMIPAQQVGGDYCDYCFDPEGALWLGIGDVSGHGVTAGLVMMMAQTAHYQRISQEPGLTPEDVVCSVNRVLTHNIAGRLKESCFMTFTTLKHTGKGDFLFAGAHLDILVYRRERESMEVFFTDGVFLNLVENLEGKVENHSLHLDPGDRMFLYTDGIIEAKNENDELLDMEGFQAILLRNMGLALPQLREAVLNDIMSWCRGIYKDDLTLVILERKEEEKNG